jgi:glycosyltransferase involved in cell wall biosynthesis
MNNLRVVAVYNRYLNRGGEDEMFEAEAGLLDRNGIEVTRVTEKVGLPNGFGEKLEAGVNAVWSARWRRKFRSILREVAPQVVHVHNFFPVFSPSIYYACRDAAVPVVQTLHNYRMVCPAATFFRDGHVCEECVEHTLWRGVRYGCYRQSRPATATVALMLALHRWCKTWTHVVDTYIAMTEFARGKFIEAGLPAEKIVIKPNFLEPDPGPRNGPGTYALFVGRIQDEKGAGLLLDAWQRLRQRIPLRVIGDGPQRSELESRALRKGVSGISFEGRQARDYVLKAMKGARFLIFPSQWYEIFGVTIVEAFACGLPVIGSRLGSVQEVVESGRTGLLFRPGDAEELAEKVEWAWAHPDRMREMGTEARGEYEAKYTGRQNYRMLVDIYRRAIENRGTAVAAHDSKSGREGSRWDRRELGS